jgi:tRNA-dihydrouridine synthase A
MALNRRFSVAPMIDWTDRHDRFFLRQISRQAVLYTEMITTGALIFGDKDRHLRFSEEEYPVALQLGGSDPVALATCAQLGADYGYDEINLNVGCPSDRVKSGSFGACLMATPELVRDCVSAMQAVVDIPVTVKCRIGIDDQDSEADLANFIEVVSDSGCNTFVVHARKAWLQGLSPKQNREIPPLDYGRVRRLKESNPDLTVVLNGGIATYEAIDEQLSWADGVMVGREAYTNPWFLSEVDERYFGAEENQTHRFDVALSMQSYADQQAELGVPIKSITRHILGLFNGLPGARLWRRHLSENAPKAGPGSQVIAEAVDVMKEQQALAQSFVRPVSIAG